MPTQNSPSYTPTTPINFISAFISDSSVLLSLLVVLFTVFTYSRLYSLPNLLKEVRLIIYGDTLLSCDPNGLESKIELERNKARAAFARYGSIAHAEVEQKRRAFGRMTREHRRIGKTVGYLEKLDRLEETNLANAKVMNAISCVSVAYPPDSKEPSPRLLSRSRLSTPVCSEEMARVREAMKHFVRDWSDEGKEERDVIFDPILAAIRSWVMPLCTRGTGEVDILVPGSGLGRLAWEVHQLGFRTTALELSPYMSLAFHFLLSSHTSPSTFSHIVHPFAYWFSHQRSNASLFRGVSFPDVLPRLSSDFRFSEGDFLKHTCSNDAGYACIVTLFFIDTSFNVLSTLQQVLRLLRPGGIWINLGPLLWHGEAQLEPCLEEVWAMCRELGFEFIEGGGSIQRKNHETDGSKYTSFKSEYTRDRDAMMHWVYEAEFWVARKARV